MDLKLGIVTPPHPCPYLASRTAKLEWSYARSLSPGEYEELMNTGHRKFGAFVFRPVCDGCSACRPVRVSVARFAPDRSQRRALRRNRDLEVREGAPEVDAERLDLLRRYHASQARRKGWPDEEQDEDDYARTFVENPLRALELTARESGELRAVMLAEATPSVLSAIYHYHDPAHARRGLGTFSILRLLEVARALGKEHLYLGYLVSGCASMTYKARFRPCEVLGQDGAWRPLA